MAVTKERFEQGMTYSAYKEQMTRNREQLEKNEQTVEFAPEDLEFFRQLPYTLDVLVLAEDWCGDVIANLPVLGALAQQTGKLNLRIFLRDQNLDLMDQYLNRGQFRSIPVFVFFDENFQELGHWIERPARIYEMQAQMRRELFANDPVFEGYPLDAQYAELSEEARDRLRAASAAFREQNRPFSDREVVREIRKIIEQGIAQPAAESTPPSERSAQSTAEGTAPAANGRVKVSIVYCADCGYEPQTLALTSALMHEFMGKLSSIEILPWQDGAFDVSINGEVVHSMYRDGGFPEHEVIIEAVRQRIG